LLLSKETPQVAKFGRAECHSAFHMQSKGEHLDRQKGAQIE